MIAIVVNSPSAHRTLIVPSALVCAFDAECLEALSNKTLIVTDTACRDEKEYLEGAAALLAEAHYTQCMSRFVHSYMTKWDEYGMDAPPEDMPPITAIYNIFIKEVA